MNNDHHKNKAQGRPKLVWVICIFYLFSMVYSAAVSYAIYSGLVALDDAQRAYFDSITIFEHIVSIALVLVSISAAVLLFQLKKLAFSVFVTAFVGGLLATMWHAFSKGWFASMVDGGIAAAVGGWAIQFAICIYCWRLIQRGILV